MIEIFLYLFDEPTNVLDSRRINKFREKNQKYAITIIFPTYILMELERSSMDYIFISNTIFVKKIRELFHKDIFYVDIR